jgi:hypothetical protein
VTPQLWIGFGFLAALVGFLIASIFLVPTMTPDQRQGVKFLTALCGGFAGGFLTGSALFEMHKTSGNTTYALSGTAGFALFFLIWIFYPTVFKLTNAFEYSIPKGWVFKEAADGMAAVIKYSNEYIGFSADELKAPMQAKKVTAKTVKDCMPILRLATVNTGAVRAYDVVEADGVFHLQIR